jgi:hypothetical protein
MPIIRNVKSFFVIYFTVQKETWTRADSKLRIGAMKKRRMQRGGSTEGYGRGRGSRKRKDETSEPPRESLIGAGRVWGSLKEALPLPAD